MTEADREARSVAPSASEIAAKAAGWLRRRDFWDWNETDQAGLDAWRAESLAHEAAFLRLEAAWTRTERLAALRPPKHGWLAGASRRRRVLARVAVGLAVTAAACIAGASYFLTAGEKTYATSLGGRQTIALSDGSQIELNTDTVLRVEADQGVAFLDRGEAYFQIKHNASHPFIVTTSKQRVIDLGTKFLVRKSTDNLEVSLVEGRARVEVMNGRTQSRSAVLVPGDVAIATADLMSVTRKPPQILENELGWRRGVLIFRHTTLADAAAEFNRYNREKIVVADDNVARRTIGGTFTTSEVERFAVIVRDVLGLHIENRSGQIVISR